MDHSLALAATILPGLAATNPELDHSLALAATKLAARVAASASEWRWSTK
jgi:hypothetical protein